MSKRPIQKMAYGFKLEEKIDVPLFIVGRPEWVKRYIPTSLSGKCRYWSEEIKQEMLDFLKSRNGYGIDTESSGPRKGDMPSGILPDGLDPVSSTSQLLLVQIGTKQRVYIIEPDLLPNFKEELENQERVKIFQNAVHDFKFILSKYGIHVNNIYCTMLAEQILTAGREGVRVGLAELARKYPPHYLVSKDVRDEFRAENFGRRLTADQVNYAARDVFLLIDIYRSQLELLKKFDLMPTARDEMACIPCTAEMELTGIKLSKERLLQTIEYYKQQEAKMSDKIIPILTEPKSKEQSKLFDDFIAGINLKSNAEKLAALQAMGLAIEDVRRSTLEEIDLEVCQLLAKYTELTKVITTYGYNLINRIHPDDGMLHPRFSQLGMGEFVSQNSKDKAATIATGRYSSDFQQLPRPKNIFAEVTDDGLLEELRSKFNLSTSPKAA